MKVVINQSNFLPWKGYFDLIHDADLFVLYDDVQYTKRDWRHRNQFKFAHGPRWVRAAVHEDTRLAIDEITLRDEPWEETLLKDFHDAYHQAPHFSWVEPFFRDAFAPKRWKRLSELNHYLLKTLCRDFLGIQTRFVNARDFAVTSAKQERILDLLKATGATTYLSGPAGKGYLEANRFEAENIGLEWKDYTGYPEYPQVWPPFTHQVSLIDLLVHTGPSAPEYIWGWRQKNAKERA